jgi:hypothetical protein
MRGGGQGPFWTMSKRKTFFNGFPNFTYMCCMSISPFSLCLCHSILHHSYASSPCHCILVYYVDLFYTTHGNSFLHHSAGLSVLLLLTSEMATLPWMLVDVYIPIKHDFGCFPGGGGGRTSSPLNLTRLTSYLPWSPMSIFIVFCLESVGLPLFQGGCHYTTMRLGPRESFGYQPFGI